MMLNATIEGRETPIILKGRKAWALQQQMTVGLRRVSTFEKSASRWSGYLSGLRNESIIIETVDEKHGRDFPGVHGGCVLRSAVAVKAI